MWRAAKSPGVTMTSKSTGGPRSFPRAIRRRAAREMDARDVDAGEWTASGVGVHEGQGDDPGRHLATADLDRDGVAHLDRGVEERQCDAVPEHG